MTNEQIKTKNSNQSTLDTELEVLSEVVNKCSNIWHDRVYLCHQDTNFKQQNPYASIKGFNCYLYSSFKNADYGWDNHRTELHKLELRHTIIPICKWVPKIFDKYILGWKLKTIYWGGEISIGSGYNKFPREI